MPVFNMMQGGGTDHTPKSQPQISAVHNMQGHPFIMFNAMPSCNCSHILLLRNSSTADPAMLAHTTAALVSVTSVYADGINNSAMYVWTGCTYNSTTDKYTALACNISKNAIFVNQTGNAVVSG